MMAFPGRTPKAILFDLDGTLIDSAPDIAAAVNELLARHDLAALNVAQVTAMIGNGVEKLVERAFDASGAMLRGRALADVQREMTPIYLEHTTRLTKLMPGAREALAALHVRGIPLACVTNKPQVAAREILLHFRLSEMLRAVIGGDAVVNKKPAPDALLMALEVVGVEPCDALMVGDSKTDVEAARNTGMPVVLVRGGYTHVAVEELGADLVLGRIDELASILQQPAMA